MNKFILLFLSLFSLSSYAKDSDINICKTVENIKDLYSSNLNYSGITLDLLKKGNILTPIVGSEIDFNSIDINLQKKYLFVSTKNIDVNSCLKQVEICSKYKKSIKYEYMCAPGIAKLTVQLKNEDK